MKVFVGVAVGVGVGRGVEVGFREKRPQQLDVGNIIYTSSWNIHKYSML